MTIIIGLLVMLCSVAGHAIDIETNTKLDEKLESISKQYQAKKVDFNILRAVEIKGLETISETTIKNQLTVFIGDKLNPFVINRNIKQIKSIGFINSIESDVQDFEGGKKWVLTIEENPIIKAIEFKGNQQIESASLNEKIRSQINDVFNSNTVRADIQSIEKEYADQGFLFAKVQKIDMPSQADERLVFYIQESTFGDITVSGNTKTKEHVILREIDLNSGDAINENELRKNLHRIYNLNYFSEVIPIFGHLKQPVMHTA